MEKIIAFFGLGAMGAPMAKNLLKAGYELHTAINRSRTAADELAANYGLKIFPSFTQAALNADVIITILPADAEVKGFLINESFAASVKPGAVIVDMSSCTTGAICEVEKYYAEKGIKVIDAPVSGGISRAAEGTLTIFASGDKAALETLHPIFEKMGRNIYNLGLCGTGKAFKNLNNLLSFVNLMGVCEVFRVAKNQNLDLEQLYDVINVSSGASQMFKEKWKRMMNEQFDPGFKISLARKDVANALALDPDIPMPISSLVYELMLSYSAYDDLDTSAMCKLLEDLQKR